MQLNEQSAQSSGQLPVVGRTPAKSRSFARYGWIFSAIGVLFLVNAFIGYRAQLTSGQNMEEIVAANGNLLRLRRVQLLIRDAETGQRGYILTGERSYRIPYDVALSELDAALADLDRSLRSARIPDTLREDFARAIGTKGDALSSTLAFAEQNGFSAAERIMEEDNGQRYMDDIRDSGQAINDELIESIIEAQSAFRRSNNQSRVTLLVSVIASVLLLAGFLYLLRVDFRHKEVVHRLLHTQATQLEETVLDRTRELEQLNEQYKNSNQELESFAYVVSHDLQEPLRKIQAFGDRLATRYGSLLDETAQDYIARMRQAALRMSTLLTDLLEFSRVNTRGLKLVEIDLNEKFKNVVDDLEIGIAQAEARVTAESLPTVRADAVQMRQLFQNLVANGIKFRRPGVTAELHVSGRVLEAGSEPIAELTFSDNGIGFDEKYRERIFVPFQRLHDRNEFPGSGMGLAICRRICERHGGSIAVRSIPGVGSNFIVRLPLDPVIVEPSTNARSDA